MQHMPNHATTRLPAGMASRAYLAPVAAFLAALVLFTLTSTSQAAVRPVNVEGLRSVQPLAPFMEYVIDPTGTLTLDEVFSPSHQGGFTPLDAGFPLRSSGGTWLRLTLAPRPADGPAPQLLLDLGDDLPGTARIYLPKRPSPAGTGEWQEQASEGRNVFTLPDPLGYPVPVYIKLEGVPGPWFAPQLRTPHNAATAPDRLARPAIVVALGVVMLLCLLRGLTERGEWRIWTSLFTAAALTQAIFGPPATPKGVIDPMALPGVLAPGIALMLLPHVARHMLRTRETAPGLDMQYMLLSLPGAALALAPLLPGMAWTARLLPLWPLFMFLLVPTSLAAVLRRLPGSRRFLVGCLAPLAGTSLSMLAIGSPAPAALIAAGPMWGLACGALLIAGAGTPRSAADEADRQSGLPGQGARGKRNPAAHRPDLLDPLAGEPGLRLITPEEQRAGDLGSHEPPLMHDDARFDGLSLGAPLDEGAVKTGRITAGDGLALFDEAPGGRQNAQQGSRRGDDTSDPGTLARMEDALRQPLDALQQALAGLSDCSLPPAARSQTEVALEAARKLGTLTGDLRKAAQGPQALVSRRAVFDLQRSLRDAHDAVEDRAEAKNLALSWFMAPHLAQLYEGDAQRVSETLRLLVESSVRATERGSIHLSVRRVPDSTDPGHLLFTVTDTGAGGPPERRSTVALARTWELATTTGGTMNVDSGPQGTTVSFSVHLTALSGDLTAPRAAAVEDLAAPAAPMPRLRPLRVLIADDVPSSRQLLTFYLEGLPHETLEARSTEEAASLYRRAPAGLVVFDGDMPEDAIVTSLGEIRAFEGEQDLPPVPVLVLVSHDEQGRRLMQAGCTDALAKPITRTGLRETVLRLAPLPLKEAGGDGTAEMSHDTGGSTHDVQETSSASHSSSGPQGSHDPHGEDLTTGPPAGSPRKAAGKAQPPSGLMDLPPLLSDTPLTLTPDTGRKQGTVTPLSLDGDTVEGVGDPVPMTSRTARQQTLELYDAPHATSGTRHSASQPQEGSPFDGLEMPRAASARSETSRSSGTPGAKTADDAGLLHLAADGTSHTHEEAPSGDSTLVMRQDREQLASVPDEVPSAGEETASGTSGESWYPWDKPARQTPPLSDRDLPEDSVNATASRTSEGRLPDLFGASSHADDEAARLPLLDLIITDPDEDVPSEGTSGETSLAASLRTTGEPSDEAPTQSDTTPGAIPGAPAGNPASTGSTSRATAAPTLPEGAQDADGSAHSSAGHADADTPKDATLSGKTTAPDTGPEEKTEADATTRPGYDLSALARASANLSAAVRASALAEEAAANDRLAGNAATDAAQRYGYAGDATHSTATTSDSTPSGGTPDHATTAGSTPSGGVAPLLSAHGEILDEALTPLVPGLVTTLEAALEDALIGRDQDDTLAVEEAACRIAGKAETFGLRVLERIAKCVERAAAADDVDAVRDLLPELQAAVERNTMALRTAPSTRKGTAR